MVRPAGLIASSVVVRSLDVQDNDSPPPTVRVLNFDGAIAYARVNLLSCLPMTNLPPTVTYSLEDILIRFEQKMDKQFAEVSQKMDKQLTEVNQKFTEVNQKFTEVNQKMDKQFTEVNQKFTEVNHRLDKMDERLTKLEVGQADIRGDVKALDERLSGEIRTLDEKVDGIGKRLDNQEFVNRGVTVGLLVALLAGIAKALGWLPPA
ncbi:MAG: hypothetical protein VKJ46_13065 [Leptolyngbyaceae bacterium]|nr:hypothetical protein [Leptolyngbyaceae bacterium]